MHAVVFQFRPHLEHHGTYFAIVAELRPELQRSDGFLHNERFAAPGDPGLLVSLSLWRDEDAIRRWREHAGHRVAQMRGKREVFASYRLRVGEVVGEEVPVGASEPLLPLAIGRSLRPASDAELFGSITEEGRELVVGPLQANAGGPIERRMALRILRDYGPGAPAERR